MKVNNMNNKITNSKKHSMRKKQTENKSFLIPLVFISAFLPLIMRFHEYNPKLSENTWFKNNDSFFDAFLYYKQIFLLITCSIMILLIAYNLYKKKQTLNFSFVLLPLFIYGLLAFLSTLISKYASYGYSGIFEQFESVFVLLSYCLIVYYSFLFIHSEEDIRFILKYLLIGILILSILGISQIIGHDFIGTKIGEQLVLPSKYWGKIGLNFNFGLHRVYLTLYNPNYVGVYVALILPILISLLFNEKNKRQIIIYVSGIIGMIICLVGSQSKTSLISFFFAFIFILLFFRKYIFRKSKATFAILGTAGVSIIIIAVISLPTITNLVNQFIRIDKTVPVLSEIKTEDKLTISYKGNDLKVDLNNDSDNLSISISDSNEKPITYNANESGIFYFVDPRFSEITFSLTAIDNLICLQFNIEGKNWVFTNQLGDNTFYYLNANGKFDKINSTNSKLFNGYEKFASGRGYIWSRTIPLLKNTFLLGTGADSFVFAFPQQDYVNLYNYGFDAQLVTRPHNLYLQIGIQSGLLSLITFLLFYFVYFITSVKLYWNADLNNYYCKVGVSIFIGTVSYMIAGISNDSSITVAPVFWVLIGIGTAINCKLKSNLKSTKIDSIT